MQDHMVIIYTQRGTSRERNFKEWIIKDPIALEAILAIETIYESQSNLEEKDSPSILKDFSSRTDPSTFTLIAPQFFDQSNRISWVFSALKPSCQTLSKQLSTSSATAQVATILTKVLAILSDTTVRRSTAALDLLTVVSDRINLRKTNKDEHQHNIEGVIEENNLRVSRGEHSMSNTSKGS